MFEARYLGTEARTEISRSQGFTASAFSSDDKILDLKIASDLHLTTACFDPWPSNIGGDWLW